MESHQMLGTPEAVVGGRRRFGSAVLSKRQVGKAASTQKTLGSI
jgi:hypothetical protein